MKNNPESQMDHAMSVLHGFRSWSHLLRFLTVILVVTALALSAALLVIRFLRTSPPISVEFTQGGATLVRVSDRPSKALYLLPASCLWAPTGIVLDPQQEVVISASGNVNLAFHRLAQSADTDEKPRHGWTGPIGQPLKWSTRLDVRREKLRISKGERYGTLLAYVRPQAAEKPGPLNPAPPGIQVVGACQRIRNKADVPAEVWLVVNEAVLSDSPEAHDAYVGTQEELNEAYGCYDLACRRPKLTIHELEQRWRYIVSQSYWDVWWDDNIGEFLVQFDFAPDATCTNEGRKSSNVGVR